ncbi:MAG: response regulator transcription factor [Lachnospiraceae bacterium]|nr:response regulator transcription factor [Lachnospiraceae bacterium]
MLRIAVCDDERAEREAVVREAEHFFSLHGMKTMIREFGSARALLLENEPSDLYLLDVVMPEVDGIKAAEMLKQTHPEAVVVFITSMIDSAVDSYRVEAAGFLLKPVTAETFAETAERLIRRGLIGEDPVITVSRGYQTVELPVRRIAVLESELHRVHIYLDGGSFSVSRRLSSFEEELSRFPQFHRCHQSFIVNMSYVRELKGSVFVLSDELREEIREVPISRAYLKSSKKAFYDRQLKSGY